MKLIFKVNVASTIRHGVDCELPPVVTLDVDPASLSQIDRDRLAGRVQDDGTVRCRMRDGDYRSSPITAPVADLAGLLAAIDSEDAEVRAYQRLRDATEAREATEREAEIVAYLATPPADFARISRATIPQPADSDRSLPWLVGYWVDDTSSFFSRCSDARVQAHHEQTTSLIKLRNATMAAEHRAGLASWIAAHGSINLQRMAAEGIKHADLYAEERAAWEIERDLERIAVLRPNWSIVDADGIEPPKRPGARAWAILDAARLVEPTAKLGRYCGKYVAYAEFEGRTIIWPAG